ncbi:hypothetical protein HPB52_008650 [Rhipicephalus sanguineus]|uniref:t-SNARE coiled-coil homology domain-containing protein n=1 Tax=Rhipicephalus sanguineus TaxID=34632 RepID=A0A9D4QM55_RHISA|nr:hypothetical protein HPB52_008650 [Rhipicephalus sanguineus]
MVTEVERHLEEANELLEQMELEVRTLSVAARPKYQNRVKSYQAELARLRKEFQRARIAFCDELKSREELLSNDDNCVGDDQRQRLLDNTERMERSTKLLKGGYKLALETEKVGAAILSDLSAQRETITRAREKVKETDYDIGKSSHVLSGMMRRAMQNRAILYLSLRNPIPTCLAHSGREPSRALAGTCKMATPTQVAAAANAALARIQREKSRRIKTSAFFEREDVEATFSFSEVYCKPAGNLREEHVHQLHCTIEWSGIGWFGPSARYSQLAHACCNAVRGKANGNLLLQWLVPSPVEALQLATHPFDRYVSLSLVSFGTLAQLGMFVQHQFSSSIIRDYYVNATFQHDGPLLHVDLHLNHRDACVAWVAECRFIVPYISILKVFINEKNRLVKIYLHLKFSAMLMEEVKNTPSRHGSAAAASPLYDGRDTSPSAATASADPCAQPCSVEVRDRAALSVVPTGPCCAVHYPIVYCPDAVVVRWTTELMMHCEDMQMTLPFPCAYAFRAALGVTVDVVDHTRALSHIMFSIDAGNVAIFAPAFYALCSQLEDEKPPHTACPRYLYNIRGVFVTPSYRPATALGALLVFLDSRQQRR